MATVPVTDGRSARSQRTRNAVVDALSPFGVYHLDMPLTAEKIWRAMPESKTMRS